MTAVNLPIWLCKIKVITEMSRAGPSLVLDEQAEWAAAIKVPISQAEPDKDWTEERGCLHVNLYTEINYADAKAFLMVDVYYI